MLTGTLNWVQRLQRITCSKGVIIVMLEFENKPNQV